MSEVLGDKSDIYNFTATHNTNSAQTRNSRRNKAVPLNTMKSNAKKSHTKCESKWRCDTFKTILSKAVWISDEHYASKHNSDIGSVINLITTHLENGCVCVDEWSSRLLLANSYYELFLFELRQFNRRVSDEEKELNMDETEANKSKSDSRSNINDIPVRKGSKFDSFIIPNIVNMANLISLVSPLKTAVNEWKTGITLGLKNAMTDAILTKLRIYYNLSSAYHAFGFYNMHKYQLKTALLLDEVVSYYTDVNSEIRLTSCYYLAKTYICLGAIKAAVSYFNSCKVDIKLKPETYGTSLVFLIKCELDLLNCVNVENNAKLLKAFIESEYLKKTTINRFYIKGLALMLATQFKGCDYPYGLSFQEFIEPIQMSFCILKRWNTFLSTKQVEEIRKNNNENLIVNTADLDPIWYRFAVIDFSFSAMRLAAYFYMNIGMPIDAIFYYNGILKLTRRYCALIWQTRLLIIGSQLDMLCDQKHYAETKLANASLSIICSMALRTEHSLMSSVSTISPETVKVLAKNVNYRNQFNSDIDNDQIEVMLTSDLDNFASKCDISIGENKCEHEKFDFWEVRKRLMKLQSSGDSNQIEENEFKLKSLNSIRLTSYDPSDDEIFQNNEFLELFLVRFEIDFYKVINEDSEYSTSLYKRNVLSDKYLKSIENFISNTLRLNVQNILSVSKNCYKISEQEFASYGLAKNTKFHLIKSMVQIEIDNKNYEEAIKLSKAITSLPTFSYEQRMIVSELIYLEAFCAFYICKQNNNFVNSIWLEYDGNLMETIDESSRPVRTPSPPHLKSLLPVPKAPKNKKEFKGQELQDYMDALKNAIYEERVEKSKAETVSDKEKKSLSQIKLNFDSDELIRTRVSMNDNLIKGEFFMEEKISCGIINDLAQQNLSNKRITRSRTRSMKQSEDKLDSNIKPINKQRSKTFNLGSKNTGKCLRIDKQEESLDYNIEEIEDLNEVFNNKLCINESDEQSDEKISYDIPFIRKHLMSALMLMSSHPSSKLYMCIQKFLVQIYSINDVNEDTVGYHFSESANSVSYRYRNLFIIEKKRKLKRDIKCIYEPLVFSENIRDYESISSFIKDVPRDWRIVQIKSVENGTNIPDLQICRFQSGKKPIFLSIKSNPEKIIKHFMVHFHDIIQRSNASIINKDRETFWRLRFSLDEELMVLLRSVEQTWFGPFRGILFGEIKNKNYSKLCADLKKCFMDYAYSENLICKKQELLDVIIESLPSLQFIEFKTAIKVLFEAPTQTFISKCYSKYEELFCSFYPIDDKQSIFSTYQISAVGLILDNSLESFPFESLPSLVNHNQQMFRIPSLRILSLMISNFKTEMLSNGIDEKSAYYVLNPSDNLAKTEEYFKESFISLEDWKGVIGKPPEASELKNALEAKDLYIFFGHGAGASYYRQIPEGLDSVNINSASLVVGCSSGKLFSDGKQLESYGTAYRFLMNGSPCYVGVLWDVTDKDIDKFSDQLLSYWISNWKSKSNENTTSTALTITGAVCKSRSICKLKYLIGASPVVYGLPLFTKQTKLNN